MLNVFPEPVTPKRTWSHAEFFTPSVNSKIAESSSQPEIKVDWRVYTKDPLKPLIRDLIVEGLSLARTQKEEFASILNSNNNDIEVLFSKLEEFISN